MSLRFRNVDIEFYEVIINAVFDRIRNVKDMDRYSLHLFEDYSNRNKREEVE